MPVFLIGLNFRSAPLELLERLAVDPERRAKAYAQLLDKEHVHEGVILSTCNRVEVYATISRFHGGAVDVRRFLAEHHGIDQQEFAGHLYEYYEGRAVGHLLGVASGVDSMVVGEGQILGQVRDALGDARAERAAGPVLSALFSHALRAGRRVRRETRIGEGLDSMFALGMRVAARQLGGIAGARVLLVGAGKMARLAGTGVRAAGAAEVVVANRTGERGAALASALGGRAVPFDRVEDELAAADLAIASTAAVAPTVGAGTVARALRRRGGRQLVMLDLGVPRDVDPAVGRLDGVVLADLNALRGMLEEEDGAQRAEVERARRLVVQETDVFLTKAREQRLVPVIRALRDRAESVRRQELERAGARLAGLDERQRAAVESVTRGLVNKLLHEPLVRGKQLAAGNDGELYANAMRALYGLDEELRDA